jgi:hypothetical protein
MPGRKVDKNKYDPFTGAEEEKQAPPLETVPPGQPANAQTAEIPGTGKPVKGEDGSERRVFTS